MSWILFRPGPTMMRNGHCDLRACSLVEKRDVCHRSVCYAWGKRELSTKPSLEGEEGRLHGEDNSWGEYWKISQRSKDIHVTEREGTGPHTPWHWRRKVRQQGRVKRLSEDRNVLYELVYGLVFTRAALTDYHKLCVLKQQLFSHNSGV